MNAMRITWLAIVPAAIATVLSVFGATPALAQEANWKQCSQEGGVCSFSGGRRVAYGANKKYTFKNFVNGARCTNEAFGSDPAPGVFKACFINMNEVPQAAPAPQSGGGAGPSWVKCATEGEVCQISGSYRVAFGIGNEWTYRNANGPFRCSVDNFADIAKGRVKSCYYETSAAVAGGGSIQSGWRRCASEGEGCTLDRPRRVAYGANGKFRYLSLSGKFACDTRTFGGDPIPGVVKACYFDPQ